MTAKRRQPDYVRETALISSGQQWSAVIILIVALVLLPILLKWTGNMTWVTFLNFTFILIIAVLGLNIISGMAGVASLGHSAFIMTGGYIFGVLTVQLDWPFWAAFFPAILVTGVIGVIVAVPAIRLKGFYVAIVTLAFLFIAQYVAKNLSITGTINGLTCIPYPEIGQLAFKSDINWYYLLAFFTAISVLVCVNLQHSRYGRAFLAIRDNEINAAILGINVPVTKLQAVFCGSFLAGLAGVFTASYISVIRPDQFTIWDSIWYLGMIIIGGSGSSAGAVMGVVFLQLIRQIMRIIGSAEIFPISIGLVAPLTYAAYGILIILFMLFQPNGIIALWLKLKTNYKRWPFGV
ncbi:MAG: branched-chain amino acid ABC transporter permease [Dehalococcoidales bacterium]|nr:branched-chain amino acid ABC transporter permease [Dehalococcoidales bacterium]